MRYGESTGNGHAGVPFSSEYRSRLRQAKTTFLWRKTNEPGKTTAVRKEKLPAVGSVDVSFRPRRSLFLRGARREESGLVIPNERRATRRRAKTGPSLRVARQMAPCVVAGLGKGTTIPCVPRLAWRHLAQQRGSEQNVISA